MAIVGTSLNKTKNIPIRIIKVLQKLKTSVSCITSKALTNLRDFVTRLPTKRFEKNV